MKLTVNMALPGNSIAYETRGAIRSLAHVLYWGGVIAVKERKQKALRL